MTNELKIYSETRRAPDVRRFSVRYMLTKAELDGLQSAGLLGEAEELVWMQHAPDAFCAQWERDSFLQAGGLTQ